MDDTWQNTENHQPVTREQAHALGRELQALAGLQATVDHDFCVLVDRFDASGALAYFDGMKSTAHWVAWACSMNAASAREHVRVARALRQMPRAKELFRQGRLSYSKVREVTRLVEVVDDGELCALALEMTASQLARTVSSYRLMSGARVRALSQQRYTSQDLENGMVRISVVLPAEQAALVDAAIEAAVRSVDPAEPVTELADGTRSFPHPDRVQALVDVAATYLDALPGEPADDHTVVMVHVNADALSVPAGTSSDDADVPAGTRLASGTCFVEGHGAVEPATAQRLICTAKVQGVLVGHGGKVLDLGRAKRLASRAQRRALRVRDKGICQFPGCHTTTHLDAHHIVGWSHGGATDLDNLILVCRRHHTLVHEGGLRIEAALVDTYRRWTFHLPDGRRVDEDAWGHWLDVDDLTELLARHSHDATEAEPTRIFPAHAGAGFILDECIRVLFDLSADAVPTAA